MSKYDLIYYCESYPAIGNGHLKRGLDIINQLIKMNSNIKIALTGNFSSNAKKFLNSRKPDCISVEDKIPNEHKTSLSILDTIKPGDANTIPENKSNKLAEISEKVFTFNTGIDQTYVPESINGIYNHLPINKYKGNTDFKKFFGPKYAPVNSKFKPTNKNRWNKNILVMIGGNQNQYGPSALAKELEQILTDDWEVDFILSPHFPGKRKSELQTNHTQYSFLQNVESVVPYMENCQLLICTYGNTTWEGLTMHKPVYVVSYLDFQKYFAENLYQKNYAVDLGYLDNLVVERMDLLKETRLHKQLINKTKKEFQTPGIINIANSILEELNV